MRGFWSCGIILFLLLSCISSYGLSADFSIWQNNPRQCHGEADGMKVGVQWVQSNDLAPLQSLVGRLPVYYPSLLYDPRIDFNRNFMIESADVDGSDIALIDAWYCKPGVPGDCEKKLEVVAESQCLLANTIHTINWIWRKNLLFPTSEDNLGTFSLYYSTDNGLNWQSIATVDEQTSYNWLIPQNLSGTVKLKVADVAHTGLIDTSSITVNQCQAAIDGDFNNDCYVTLSDFAILGQYWFGECSPDNNWCGGADFDSSTTVDFADLLIFTQNWLRCANPCDPACSQP